MITKRNENYDINISASYTCDWIERPLQYLFDLLGLSTKISFAPYNQVFQQLLDSSSLLAKNQSGLNIILLRFEDWLHYKDNGFSSIELNEIFTHIEKNVSDLLEALIPFLKHYSNQHILAICPPSTEWKANHCIDKFCSEMEAKIHRALQEINNILFIKSATFEERYNVADYYDSLNNRVNHIPYSREFFCSMALVLGRKIDLLLRLPHKVIVLDCDNTLWKGICGEVGYEKIQLTPSFLAFQKSMLEQYEAGMLLCLCSKNIESDVWAVFENRYDMLLGKQHVSDYEINWNKKSDNIKKLSKRLNLALGSFIFIDDNPTECAEVKANCPEVLVLQLPEEEKIESFTRNMWLFDHRYTTKFDKNRTAFYQKNMERNSLLLKSSSFKEFLKKLQLRIEFSKLEVDSNRCARVSQLTQRTNQFNFTSIRRTSSEIALLLKQGFQCFTVEVTDRFGDYGLVGAFILHAKDKFFVETFLLSCRVLSKGVEHAMLRKIGHIAELQGYSEIEFSFSKTAKNRPALDFLENLGKIRLKQDSQNKACYVISASDARLTVFEEALVDKVGSSSQINVMEAFNVQATAKESRASIYTEIAERLTTPKQLFQTLVETRDIISTLSTATSNEKFNILEKHVLFRLKKLLKNSDNKSVHKNMGFFDMGLSSLEAVELSNQLQIDFQCHLQPTICFEYSTVISLSTYLGKQLGIYVPVTSKKQNKRIIKDVDSKNQSVAVIGMGCRFPGGVSNPSMYWDILASGKDSIIQVPKSRWDNEVYYDPDPLAPGKINTKCAGILTNPIDEFDPQFFSISPREAKLLDPQQRLLLEVVWEALEDACIAADELSATQTGVFIGALAHDYYDLVNRAYPEGNAYAASGNLNNMMSGRLSYFLGLNGPSMVIDTACSSSLVAVHSACQSLITHESDLTIVGGVNLLLTPDLSVNLSKARMLSPDGRCKTFDAGANGYSRAEGCGILILKRLSEAQRDGDRVLGLIKGSAVNQDGASSGLTVPNGVAQVKVINQALSQAQVDPLSVSYIEAHGTGTSLGDPIEVRALSQAYCANREANNPLVVGSVKTNIGHLEGAAGIAGVIKTLLSLRHKTIPRHLHFKELNPHIELGTGMVIPVEERLWSKADSNQPRRAGVSSFGFSGTNAHVILEEAPEESSEVAVLRVKEALALLGERHKELKRFVLEMDEAKAPDYYLLPLSGKSEAAVESKIDQLQSYLEGNSSVLLRDVAGVLQTGRSHFDYRAVFVARDVEEAKARLCRVDVEQSSRTPKVGFLFTGQGSQYVGMGKELYEKEPVFKGVVDYCSEKLLAYLDRPLQEVLFGEENLLEETVYAQPGLFTLEYGLSCLWRSWGVEPSVLLGHSVGEIVAATLAGCLDLDEALELIAARGRWMQGTSPGRMLVIESAGGRVEDWLRTLSLEKSVGIAAYNSAYQTVVSGESSALSKLTERLQSEEVKHKYLGANRGFHSPLLSQGRKAFESVVKKLSYREPSSPWISNVTGKKMEQAPDAGYWLSQAQCPVQFMSGIKNLVALGVEVIVEIGPQPVLSSLGEITAGDAEIHWLPSLKKKDSDERIIKESLGCLYTAGVDIDWKSVVAPSVSQKIALPTYPFQRQRYWALNSDEDNLIKRLDQLKHLIYQRVPEDVNKKSLKHSFENLSKDFTEAIDSQWQLYASPFIKAAGKGQQRILEMFLSRGVNVNQEDKIGRSALYVSVYANQFDSVKTLLAHGAVMNKKSVYDMSPIHCALRKNHEDIIKELLAYLPEIKFSFEEITYSKEQKLMLEEMEAFRNFFKKINPMSPTQITQKLKHKKPFYRLLTPDLLEQLLSCDDVLVHNFLHRYI